MIKVPNSQKSGENDKQYLRDDIANVSEGFHFGNEQAGRTNVSKKDAEKDLFTLTVSPH